MNRETFRVLQERKRCLAVLANAAKQYPDFKDVFRDVIDCIRLGAKDEDDD